MGVIVGDFCTAVAAGDGVDVGTTVPGTVDETVRADGGVGVATGISATGGVEVASN
jgi:hypothetical protein